MSSSQEPPTTPGISPASDYGAPPAVMAEVNALLTQVEQAVGSSPQGPSAVSPQVDRLLAQVRLGIAGSLYTALRCKHATTAGHALRVALEASAWASRMELGRARQDMIEVAALLHDVGVIGVPDSVLLKPTALSEEESRIIERSRLMGIEILQSACVEPEILEIVDQVPAWFDGSRQGYSRCGSQIHLGARMIAIIESYDAMTSDRVYRRAWSQERATGELFRAAGSRFDPELVQQFVTLQAENGSARLRREAAGQWLQTLDPVATSHYWAATPIAPAARPAEVQSLFPARLLDNMHDAVAFVDAELRITYWNHGAERLTGITSDSVFQHLWSPSLLGLRNEKGQAVADDDCPVRGATLSGVQSLRRLSICGRTGRTVAVDTHAMPVTNAEGMVLGAVLLLHDASSETSLELRCQNLHEKATRDPLTQVANRAEFDRVLETFVLTHRQQRVPCSMIICDLDRFKLVNDTFGHQAGDDAIKSLASLMKSSCRPGDLVARYGGEEFVMLCADCDNGTAARRADSLRLALSQIRLPRLNGRSITASFGVTEVQPGDTPETMLRRADRALLMAKEKGRNMVIQLGGGSTVEIAEENRTSWWRRLTGPVLVLKQNLLTPVPFQMALEKLRGFAADHRARIVKLEGNSIWLEIDDTPGPARRTGDRPVGFRLELAVTEEQLAGRWEGTTPSAVRTRFDVTVTPLRNRDRRRQDIAQRAGQVMASVRSYLMAVEEDAATPQTVLSQSQPLLCDWLG